MPVLPCVVWFVACPTMSVFPIFSMIGVCGNTLFGSSMTVYHFWS